MAILTDTDLIRAICRESPAQEDQILISPFQEKNLTPMSYDLRVGGIYKKFNSETGKVEKLNTGEEIVIKSGVTVLIVTKEIIELPQDGSVSALIVSKVKQVSRGLSNISTKVDPGWAGQLRIAVHNFSGATIRLSYDESFCTIIFVKNQSNAQKLYNRRQDFDPLKLAQPQRRWRWRYWMIRLLPIIIIVAAVGIGFTFTKNTFGFGPTLAAGVAIAQVVSTLTKE